MRRRCLARGCATLIAKGSYCHIHAPYRDGWSYLRGQILRRDDYRCKCDGCGSCMSVVHGQACTRMAVTVDHINGVVQDNAPENLKAACRECNAVKGGLA